MTPTRSLLLAAALTASLAPLPPLFAQPQPKHPTPAEIEKAARDAKLKSIEDRLKPPPGGRPADAAKLAEEQAAIDELKTFVTDESKAGRDAADIVLRVQNSLSTRHPADLIAVIDIALPSIPDNRFAQRRDLQGQRVRCQLRLNQTDDAIASFKKLLATEGPDGMRQLCDDMVPLYTRLQKFSEIEELETQLILAKPEDTVRVGEALVKQITAYNAEKKYDKAASAAKQYFNVSLMKDRTADAMLLVARQLPLAFPDDKTIAERFRQEQIDGQIAPPGSETQPASLQKPTAALAKIKIDAAAYEAAAKDILDVDYDSLVRRGNLLLLADHAAEAKSCFETALQLASEKNQPQNANTAAEGVARSLKALDGAIGRANAYATAVSNK
jgi:hypothetical protein